MAQPRSASRSRAKSSGKWPGLADLEQQQPVRPVAERRAVGGDRGQRVLAREARGEIERGQRHHRLRRQAERGPVECRGTWRCGGERRRHHAHPPRQQRLDGRGGEMATAPRSRGRRHARPPRGRHCRQLPGPVADHPSAAQQPARQPQQRRRQQRRVDVDQQRRARGQVRGRRRGAACPGAVGRPRPPGGDA